MNHTNEFKNLASLHEANDSCDTWYVTLLPLLSLLFLLCQSLLALRFPDVAPAMERQAGDLRGHLSRMGNQVPVPLVTCRWQWSWR